MTHALTLTGLFGIGQGNMVALVGCGGKTSLLRALAGEWRDRGRVLVSTTTKLGGWEMDFCHRVYSTPQQWQAIPQSPGIYAVGVPQGAKLAPPPAATLEQMRGDFSLTLLECDGSRRLPLKGWREDEPVVPPFADMTIGVATVHPIGKPADSGLIFQPDLFWGISGARPGQAMAPEHLAAAIAHPRGLFHRAQGRRVLYFNQVEDDRARSLVKQVMDCLPPQWLRSLDTAVAGSLHRHTCVSLTGEKE